MPVKGKLIALEGTDRAALNAQSERLYRWLCDRGIAVEQTQEPTFGPVGAQIRLYQQERLAFDPASLALLCTADRMDHLRGEGGILSWLGDGRHVLCIHYLLHSYAMQVDQIELEWLERINALCPAPDLTLFIHTPLLPGSTPEAERLCLGYALVIERARQEGQVIEHIDGGIPSPEIDLACQRRVAALLDLDR